MPPIYHITHVANLRRMIGERAIWSNARMIRTGRAYENIGHTALKERRIKCEIPLAGAGRVGDYVPFYFAPRSPMLYVIWRGAVAGLSGDQRSIVYLVSHTDEATTRDLRFLVSDGQANARYTRFSDTLTEGLRSVDWTAINSRFWNDTQEEPDRKRRRLAEFLVRDSFPWDAIRHIGVYGVQTRQLVETALRLVDPACALHRPTITIARHWYFE